MKLIIQNSRVIATATDDYSGSDASIPAPEGFDVTRMTEYRVVNGEVAPLAPSVLIATKYKFRMALLNAGLLDDIESFIAVTEDTAVKIAWQYADEYRTDDPLVLGMGDALGKTDAEIRAVFELANTL